ncbi:MAG: hypothetical protein GYB31_19155 [Bacteroidetes bacterium]|nr:hypothetical protein [Bacteroidota bacterium]
MRTFFLFLFTLLLACQAPVEEKTDQSQLGELHESFSISEEAKADFEKGLLLLHNFEYEDARESFLAAQEKDPESVMVYWGEAMTYNHPLWRRQEQEDGAAALAKLAPDAESRSAKAATKLEAEFLKGAEILFGEGEKKERDQAYSDHMKYMYEAFPDNEEVAAFYALSILGAVKVGRDSKAYEAGAEIAQGILMSNPNHPGALHYLIHSYDDPEHAHLALKAASSYSEVAADAVHALHMPSHIFLAVGMWEEVVKSNIASFDASIRRKAEKDLDNDALSYHALSWLQYGHLQLGQFEEAKKIMDDMITYTDTLPSSHARGYCIAMKGAYLLETGDWEHPIHAYEIAPDELRLPAQAKIHFMDGMMAYREGDAEKTMAARKAIEDDIKSNALLVDESGIPMCQSGGGSYNVNRLDLDQSQVMAFQLRALEAQLQGDGEQTEKWLQEATALEGALNYGYGPPTILKPSYEMYGEWLLEQDRISEAKTQFEKSLERAPKRRLSLLGLENCQVEKS